MRGVRLAGADLTRVNLTGGLAGVNLTEADLTGACLRGASLEKATWRGACLRGADVRGIPWLYLMEVSLQPGVDLREIHTDRFADSAG